MSFIDGKPVPRAAGRMERAGGRWPAAWMAMHETKYGHFDPSLASFTVTDPGAPTPWTNVVCDGRYGFIVSHNGGGFSWLDDAQHNVLTRWEMDLVRDDRGKLLYVLDLDSWEVWSAAPAPCRPAYDRYACEHAPGRTTFRTELHGVEVEWTMSLAWGMGAEVWCVTVRNRTQRPRRLRLCSYLEWCCGAAPDAKREFHKLFFETGHDAARNALVATKTMWDLPGGSEAEHWNRPWPYAAAHMLRGDSLEPVVAAADKQAFLGRYGQPAHPLGLLEPPAIGAGCGRHGDAVAALGGDLVLGPGGETSLHFVLAVAESIAAVGETLDRLSTFGAAEEAVLASDGQWRGLLGDSAVRSGWPDFDAMNTTWLPYQAMSGRLFGRTGYYQQSGAFGFRDQLQDSQVWLARRPERTLEQIERHAARQYAGGAVQHWWHALADFGNPTECSDDYLWLPFVAANYLRETGDVGVLGRTAPFLDDASGATILEHCRRAFTRAFGRISERGLPLIGSCDWNDGLSAVGVRGKGESVWMAFFLIDLLRDWSRILGDLGDHAALEYAARRSALVEAVNEHAWDGAWFRRATRDDGRWLGSGECEAGSIYLNPQTWAIMSDGTTPERASAAWAGVKARLLTDYGPLLLAPAYTEPDASIGYITRYPPGSRENGGVYTHAATWALAAAAKMGEQETVARVWRSLSPILRSARDADVYAAEPYVLPGNSDGPLAPAPGRAGWTWYTGSAAWLNRICLEWVLGVRPTWEGLLIDPCAPREMGVVEVTRRWRGAGVRVRFDAAECARGMRPVVRVNGRPLGANTIRPGDIRGESEIDVAVSWEPALPEPVIRTESRRSTV